jgi:DNA-binding transcriptional regulator YhcF (GntR family)
MNYKVLEFPVNLTARSRIVATLTQEILNSPEKKTFPIESENKLCRRFNVSRVTVRHALSDLEHRGLIFRKHGKGTFAHGRSTRVHRNIAFLFKSPQSIEQKPIMELIQGAHTTTASLRSALILISASPTEWRTDMTSSLGGVIVMPKDVTLEELDIFKYRKLPFISIGESHLPTPRFIPATKEFSFFQAGQQAAEILSRAAVTGESLSDFSIDSPLTDEAII